MPHVRWAKLRALLQIGIDLAMGDHSTCLGYLFLAINRTEIHSGFFKRLERTRGVCTHTIHRLFPFSFILLLNVFNREHLSVEALGKFLATNLQHLTVINW